MSGRRIQPTRQIGDVPPHQDGQHQDGQHQDGQHQDGQYQTKEVADG